MTVVPFQGPVVAQVPMIQPKGVKKPMNKNTMMLIAGGLLLTIIGLVVVFRKNKKTQVAVEIKPTKSEDKKKVEVIEENLEKIEKTILGFRVKEGVNPIMDSFTSSAAEVQDFIQNEVCAVINHDDAIKTFEKSLSLPDTIQCKGDKSVERGTVMLYENIDKMKKIAEKMTPEMKKLVLSLVKNTEKMIEELENQVCGDGKTEVKKEDILKIVKNLRLSLCGHVEKKTSKEEALKKIDTVMKLVPSLMFGRSVARVQEADPKTYRSEKITIKDGVEVPKYRVPKYRGRRQVATGVRMTAKRI